MKKVLRLSLWFVLGLVLSGVLALGFLAVYQERFLFHPSQLPADYKFSSAHEFQEVYLQNGEVRLHGLHFPHPNPKGAILFLHGNAQTVQEWGDYVAPFHKLGYDFYIFDYRSYGKSTGKITNEAMLYQDANLMFEYVMKKFPKEQISVLGYSIGTGLAAHLGEKYQPQTLILFAPYFSLENLIKEKVPFVPSFLIRYRIPSYKFLAQAKNSKITIFHGKSDQLIPASHSQKLAPYLKPQDKVIFVAGEHGNLLNLAEVWKYLQEIL